MDGKKNPIILLISLLLLIQMGVAIYKWKTLLQEQMSKTTLNWKAGTRVMFQIVS